MSYSGRCYGIPPEPTIRIPGVDTLIDSHTINKVLGVLHVSNSYYIYKDWDIDILWLWGIFLEQFREWVY